MHTENRQYELLPTSGTECAGIPAYERVLDRLANLLFDADDVLDMLKADDATSIRWIAPRVQNVYDEVNAVMKKLCD